MWWTHFYFSPTFCLLLASFSFVDQMIITKHYVEPSIKWLGIQRAIDCLLLKGGWQKTGRNMTSIPIWDRFSPRVIGYRILRVLCNSSKGTAQEQTFLSHQMVFDSFALVTHLPCLWTKSFLISILQPCLSPMKVTLTIYLTYISIQNIYLYNGVYISIQNIYLYKISIYQPCLSQMKVTFPTSLTFSL